jgi:hypothetical protein
MLIHMSKISGGSIIIKTLVMGLVETKARTDCACKANSTITDQLIEPVGFESRVGAMS